MEISRKTGKIVVAVCRPYRSAMIYETADGFAVIDDNGKGHEFGTRAEAIQFVDFLFQSGRPLQAGTGRGLKTGG